MGERSSERGGVSGEQERDMAAKANPDTQFHYSYQPHRWHPHNTIIRMVGSSKRVLDVGCASGYLAKKFKANDCSVIGV